MKKILFSIIALLAVSCTFIACGSEGDEGYSYATTADKATEGTYTGTWTRTLDGVSTTFEGTVTLVSAGKTGVSNITFSCPSTSLNATSVANVWNAKNDFQFMNQTISDANGLGAAFSGIIYESGSLTAGFTIKQTEGRKSYNYQYSFVGKK